MDKALFKLGIAEYKEPFNWKVDSWENSLDQMNVDADIVFFGDSITRGGQWADVFPDRSIVNLGISGDSIYGMSSRVDMIAAVSPKKVFICGGVNSLTDRNLSLVVEQYKTMLDRITEVAPDAELYIQSVLPISKTKEKECADNKTIVTFNAEIEKLAVEYDAEYIDVHTLYVVDGHMNPKLTTDGIHLKSEAYASWYEMIREHIYD